MIEIGEMIKAKNDNNTKKIKCEFSEYIMRLCLQNVLFSLIFLYVKFDRCFHVFYNCNSWSFVCGVISYAYV